MDDNDQISSTHRIRGSIPNIPSRTRWDRLWSPFWAIPAAGVTAALVLGLLLPAWERGLDENTLSFVFQGGPDAAREVLGTIASSTISVTGLIFSITLVVLQLVSSQFSPRMLSGFLRNRIVQATLAMFLGTFVFSLTVIRYVWSEDEEITSFVPRASVSLAFLLVLSCLGFFLAFIRLITASMRVANAISDIGEETLDLAKRLYPVRTDDAGPVQGPGWSPRPGDPRIALSARTHGSLVWINYKKLVRWAREHDAVITVDRAVGDFVVTGQPLLRVWWDGELEDSDLTTIYSACELRTERELHQDVAFGLRQLVDIADRALSPGINDPATAAQSIQELHRIFRYLVTVVEPSPYIADEDGHVRVVHRPQNISAMLDEVVREIHFYGSESAIVPRLLQEMVEDLTSAASDTMIPAVENAALILRGEGTEDVAKR
ncbi:DUF2254 domain-containing protein [Flaviflexus equikiangi]|uniref:DUF2254 domain-containing protein n=1 Tax=Flaviflexus equikiangi TaxID=2758573 RepID=A0ABS2TCY7_9ACTO|nr:DUF2254 family protein [Flaviflexus equikiangi]MBM9432516.1 DUF2254 domain-containing protein [Flaviflexus equikiangi]